MSKSIIDIFKQALPKGIICMSPIKIANQSDRPAIVGMTRPARWRELIEQELNAIPTRILNETGGQLRLKFGEQVREFLLNQIAKNGYHRRFIKQMVERHLFRPLLQLVFTGQIKANESLSVEVSDDGKRLYFNCLQDYQRHKKTLL
jgi:hypothetical protein